jgi:hypothetical protein
LNFTTTLRKTFQKNVSISLNFESNINQKFIKVLSKEKSRITHFLQFCHFFKDDEKSKPKNLQNPLFQYVKSISINSNEISKFDCIYTNLPLKLIFYQNFFVFGSDSIIPIYIQFSHISYFLVLEKDWIFFFLKNNESIPLSIEQTTLSTLNQNLNSLNFNFVNSNKFMINSLTEKWNGKRSTNFDFIFIINLLNKKSFSSQKMY